MCSVPQKHPEANVAVSVAATVDVLCKQEPSNQYSSHVLPGFTDAIFCCLIAGCRPTVGKAENRDSLRALSRANINGGMGMGRFRSLSSFYDHNSAGT